MMALQGRAIKFGEIIYGHHGENKLILPGTFDRTLESGDAVQFRFSDHDGPCIGSVNELFSDHDGLYFRFNNFPDNTLGRECRAIAESNEPSTLSIGFNYRYAKKSKRQYGGVNVMAVSQAWLWEITWLVRGRPGADQHAFASYENVDGSSGLADDVRSGKLKYDFAAVGVRRALQKASQTI
jgi:HK97 family phage prohead protease